MSLRLVVPFSVSDLPFINAYLGLMEHFAGIEKNNVLVVARKDVEAKAVEVADRLRKLAKSSTLHLIPEIVPHWPTGPNDMFVRTVNYLRDSGNTEPWLWMEPDAPPIAPGWAGALLGAHNEGGKPHTGRLLTTMDSCPNPSHPSAKEQFDGEHMNGVGIYPHDFHVRSQLYKMANRERPPIPWDIYCRWEIAPHCTNTDLIVGVKRATEFAKIDGGYSYLSNGERKEVQTEGAVMLHSCKDASLAAIITGRTYEIAPVPEPAAPEVAAAPESSAESNGPQGDPAAGIPGSSPHETKTPAEPLSLISKVAEVVADKQKRLGDLSKALGRDKAELRTILLESGKFTITAMPFEWVKRRAA